jgi:hypothetical protein
MNTATKRRFLSGFPWWFSIVFIGLCIFFALLVIALRPASFPWAPLRGITVTILGFLVLRLSSPQIYLGDDCLYISRIWRKATIPLDKVASIYETKSWWPFRSYSSVIHFATDTPFGRSLYLGSFGIVPSMTFPWVLKDLKSALQKLSSKRSNQSMELPPGHRTTQLSDD